MIAGGTSGSAGGGLKMIRILLAVRMPVMKPGEWCIPMQLYLSVWMTRSFREACSIIY